MIFQDNVIKNLLCNVYFITGTPCGGKTTLSRALGKKYGLPVYDVDAMFPYHRALSDRDIQTAMNMEFKDADEFYGRSVEEYKDWLVQNTREQLDFILTDLIRLSQNGIVICDCHLTLELAEKITDPSRIAFMLRDPHNLAEEYCNRPDHTDFRNYINSASDVKAAKKKCSDTLFALNEEYYHAVKASGFFWLDRGDNRSVEEAVRLTERHFGWKKLDGLTIERVEKDTSLAHELLRFIENCSWDEVKDSLAKAVRNWEYTDWESMFAAVVDGKIVGITSICKSDYYPLPEIYPWVSAVFVSPEYRGNRISEKLISRANRHAVENGFTRTYIPSPYTGLYERYGYRYTGDIKNYGGGTDRLYVKELAIY